jgi:hypothetical protein
LAAGWRGRAGEKPPSDLSIKERSMEKRNKRAAVGMIALVLALAVAAHSASIPQTAGGSAPPSLDRATKDRVVEWVSAKLAEIYVFPDVAAKAAALLREKLRTGAYDAVSEIEAFARTLTGDLREVAHDKHMGVRYAAAPSYRDKKENEEEERRRLEVELLNWRLDNFFFKKVEHLDGNVGYLRFDEFVDARYAGDAAVAAMNFLGRCDALIFDLRGNRGGNETMVKLLQGYLFGEETHVCDVEVRSEGKTYQSWTPAYVPGPRLDKADVYVLTSRATFSAAEEFAYDLQSRKRATVVGETTGGGGHTVRRVWNGDLKVELAVPNGRAVNPVTGTNWEGKGVAPDVACPADQALDKAYALALAKLHDKAAGTGNMKAWLKSLLDYQQGVADPKAISLAEMEAFQGSYGPARVVIEDGTLVAVEPNGTRRRMLFQGADTFILEGNKDMKLVFERNAAGEVAAVLRESFDGSRGGRLPKDRKSG